MNGRMQIAVETVDRLCGEILNVLKETGEYEETVLLFTTDHGLPFPMMKKKATGCCPDI